MLSFSAEYFHAKFFCRVFSFICQPICDTIHLSLLAKSWYFPPDLIDFPLRRFFPDRESCCSLSPHPPSCAPISLSPNYGRLKGQTPAKHSPSPTKTLCFATGTKKNMGCAIVPYHLKWSGDTNLMQKSVSLSPLKGVNFLLSHDLHCPEW